MKDFDPYKPELGHREPGLQDDGTTQDQSGGEDSVPRNDYPSDGSFDVTDGDEQFVT